MATSGAGYQHDGDEESSTGQANGAHEGLIRLKTTRPLQRFGDGRYPFIYSLSLLSASASPISPTISRDSLTSVVRKDAPRFSTRRTPTEW
jgi:hypothetical protein